MIIVLITLFQKLIFCSVMSVGGGGAVVQIPSFTFFLLFFEGGGEAFVKKYYPSYSIV